MASDCRDYEQRGYCVRGKLCPNKHGNDLIELDVSGYDELIRIMRISIAKAAAETREKQQELKRKQTDLLSNLVSQQKALIKKIELCADEAEKIRLKRVLDEMSQKTKDWIEQESARKNRVVASTSSGETSKGGP